LDVGEPSQLPLRLDVVPVRWGGEHTLKPDLPALLPDLDRALRRELGLGANPSEDKIAKVLKRAADDPEYYVFGGFVRTIDEHDSSARRKPFPRKRYLFKALDFFHSLDEGGIGYIIKSRQLMLTWLACAYATHQTRFSDNARTMIQTKKAEDAWNLVYKNSWYHARCAFIERAMPPFMRANGLKGLRGELIYPEGGTIWGIPQGPDMFRSYTATLVIGDECCFQPEFEASYMAALPMIKGGGRGIFISSAAPDTYFGKLVEQGDVYELAV